MSKASEWLSEYPENNQKATIHGHKEGQYKESTVQLIKSEAFGRN